MVFILSWLIFSFVVMAIAEARGRSVWSFFWLSLLASPLIALIVLVVTPPTREQAERLAMRGGDSKRCPHCAELVKREALVCKHCHVAIPATAVVTPAPPVVPLRRSEAWTVTSYALLTIVLLMLGIIVVRLIA